MKLYNELCNLFLNINDNENLTLEKGKVYHIRQDDSFEFEGYYCTNTAKRDENPNGLRRTAMFLKDKKNIVIDGNGATVIVHGKMTPFLFDNSENITVKNLTVDYACPTMTEFEILSNENGICVIRISPECFFEVRGNNLIWKGENDLDGNPYWSDSYIGNKRYIKVFDPIKKKSKDFRRDNLEFEEIEQLDDLTLKVRLKNKEADFIPGCIFQTRNIIRDQTGAYFNRCKNLYFENLRIKFMHGLGMVSQFCENVTYKNCDFTPGEGRTIASTADFFQFSGCKGNLVVDSCKAWGAQDDYINVHGTHLRIVEQNTEEKSLTVRFIHAESWGFQAFEKGDELEFIKWDTLIPYASATVTDYLRLNDTDIKIFVDGIPDGIVLEKDVVENATWTPNLHVKNCDFGTTSGRGVLCTTRGKVIIENNRFVNLWGPALLLEDDCNFWFESGYTKEVIFRNNFVSGCEYAEMWKNAPVIRYTPKVMDENSTEYVHGRLVVSGNIFENPRYDKHCFHLEYLREAEITDNKFDAPFFVEKNVVGNIIEENNII